MHYSVPFFAWLFLFFLLPGFYPTLDGQPIYNAKIGLHSSALEAELDGVLVEGRLGWQVGLDARIGGGTFYLQPGVYAHRTPLRFTRKDGNPAYGVADSHLFGLRMPLLLGMRLSRDPLITAWHLRAGGELRWNAALAEREGFAPADNDLEPWVPAARLELGLDILFLTVDVGYSLSFSSSFSEVEGRDHGLIMALGISF